MVPIVKKDNNEDSEINYDGADNSSNNKENQLLCPPISYIPNIPNSLLFYPIYVKNPAYRGPRQDNNFTPGREQQVILAPFIKYSTNYAHIFGTLGEGQEVWSLVVQVGKQVRFPQHITSEEWKHLEEDNDREFTINAVLTEINDPWLTGEIARYRGYAKLKTTLDGFLKEAHSRVCQVMAEVVKVDEELKKCKQRLKLAGAYHEIANHFDHHFPLPTCPHHSPIQSSLLEPPAHPSQSPDHLPMDPTNPHGPVEMPVLANEPRGLKRKCCFQCKSTNHILSKCPNTHKNSKCIKCRSSTHKIAKCRYRTTRSPPPFEEGKIILPFTEAVQKEEMPLLDRIALLDKEQWTPEVCGHCSKVNPNHTELGCLLYEQCTRCMGTGPAGFLHKHTC